MSRPAKTPYKTTNWHNYNQALRQRGSLTVWFDPSMQWEAAPSGRRGRQQAYSDAAIQACLTIKVLLGLPLRQTTGFVASLLELSGLAWAVPDFSTLSRRQLREAARPAAYVPGIRPPGGGGPDPGGGPQPLHGTRHPDEHDRRISVPGDRGIALAS